MNKFIENFYDLYSPIDQKVYKAILEKKDWMFRKLFWAVDFSSYKENDKVLYPNIYALMDKSVPFHSFEPKGELFVDHEDKIKIIKEKFDESYACAYFYGNIDKNMDKGIFFVEMDFYKMDEKTYKELVANFYPCIDKVEDLDLFYNENKIEDLLKYPMYGPNNKFVITLSKDLLMNGKYYMPFIKKIYYSKDKLDEKQIEAVDIIASKLEIEKEEY